MRELFGGGGNVLYFNYGVCFVGANVYQYLSHSKWLHFILCELYHSKLLFRNIKDKPNDLLSASIKMKRSHPHRAITED